MNQIKDYDLTDQIQIILEMKKSDPSFDTRFEYKNDKFSIWVDEDPKKHKLYRLTPGADSPKSSNTSGSSSNSTSSSGYSNRPSFQKGAGGFFDSKSHDCVTLEKYKEESAKDPLYRPLTAKDKTPNNFVLYEDGKRIIMLWVGKWIKSSNN